MTSPEQRRYVSTKDFMQALHDAGILPQFPWCTRVVIDCDGRQGPAVVKMYVDQIAPEALLTIPALMAEAGGVPDPPVEGTKEP